MYNHTLDTFVRAAELGSFSKVAEESYISSHTADQSSGGRSERAPF